MQVQYDFDIEDENIIPLMIPITCNHWPSHIPDPTVGHYDLGFFTYNNLYMIILFNWEKFLKPVITAPCA